MCNQIQLSLSIPISIQLIIWRIKATNRTCIFDGVPKLLARECRYIVTMFILYIFIYCFHDPFVHSI